MLWCRLEYPLHANLNCLHFIVCSVAHDFTWHQFFHFPLLCLSWMQRDVLFSVKLSIFHLEFKLIRRSLYLVFTCGEIKGMEIKWTSCSIWYRLHICWAGSSHECLIAHTLLLILFYWAGKELECLGVCPSG